MGEVQHTHRALLAAGIYRGPVNHIRSFSGFPRLPSLVMETLAKSWPHPIVGWSYAAGEALTRVREL